MGILGTGGQLQGNAIAGLRRAAGSEEQTNTANRQINAAEKAQKISTTVAGASTGAAIGAASAASAAASTGAAMAMGPIGWGLLAGAAAGYLLSEVF